MVWASPHFERKASAIAMPCVRPRARCESSEKRWHGMQAYLQRRAGQRQLSLTEVLAAGGFSGACIAATLHPLFVVKTHQQVNRLSTLEAATRLWHGEGIRGPLVRLRWLRVALEASSAAFRAASHDFRWRWGSSSSPTRRPRWMPGAEMAGNEAWAVAQCGAQCRELESERNSSRGDASGAVATLRNSASVAEISCLHRGIYGASAGVLCWTAVFPLDAARRSPRAFHSSGGAEPCHGRGRVRSRRGRDLCLAMHRPAVSNCGLWPRALAKGSKMPRWHLRASSIARKVWLALREATPRCLCVLDL